MEYFSSKSGDFSDSPEQDVCVPARLTELASPANLLSVQSEVLCDPQYGVRFALALSLTELLRDSARTYAESQSALRPGVGPAEPLVVVYLLSRERPLVFAVHVPTEALFQRHLLEGDIEPSQSDVQADAGLDLLLDPHWEHIGLVLSEHARLVRVPLVAKVGYQNDAAYEECYKHPQRRPQALQRER